MNVVAFHFAGGDALFSGAALLAAGCAGGRWLRRGRCNAVSRLSALLGAIFVALSAAPLPWWFYAAWGIALMVWLATTGGERQERRLFTIPRISAAAVTALAFIAAGSEFIRLSPPELSRPSVLQLAVIGDSISAGMLDTERVWPTVLQSETGIPVLNLAEAGATARSAARQAERLGEKPLLVIVEIGGNDLLGPTTAEQFERDLDRLFRMLQADDREIVMLELPLPPTFNRFGRVQRRLAADYNVRLIHRRHFARVLFLHSGGTLDGLHLSNSGHAAMARMIHEQLRLEGPSLNEEE